MRVVCDFSACFVPVLSSLLFLFGLDLFTVWSHQPVPEVVYAVSAACFLPTVSNRSTWICRARALDLSLLISVQWVHGHLFSDCFLISTRPHYMKTKPLLSQASFTSLLAVLKDVSKLARLNGRELKYPDEGSFRSGRPQTEREANDVALPLRVINTFHKHNVLPSYSGFLCAIAMEEMANCLECIQIDFGSQPIHPCVLSHNLLITSAFALIILSYRIRTNHGLWKRRLW